MAKKGLPKKYAKMGFARGWKAYKASKRTTRKAGPTMAKRKRTRTSSRVKSVARKTYQKSKPAINRGMKYAVGVGTGVGGAMGTAIITNMLPVANARTKAIIQMLMGAGLIMFAGKKMNIVKYAGTGATLAGALALTKLTLPANLSPMLAGYDQAKQIPYYRRPARKMNENISYSPKMGINSNYSMGASGAGYGGKFLTPANM